MNAPVADLSNPMATSFHNCKTLGAGGSGTACCAGDEVFDMLVETLFETMFTATAGACCCCCCCCSCEGRFGKLSRGDTLCGLLGLRCGAFVSCAFGGTGAGGVGSVDGGRRPESPPLTLFTSFCVPISLRASLLLLALLLMM